MEIYKFENSTCNLCVMLDRTLDKMGLSVHHIDTNENENNKLVEKYNIERIPALVFTNGEEYEKIVGMTTIKKINDKINEMESKCI